MLDTTEIVTELANRTNRDPRGRRGYSKESLWRAYVASFVMNHRYTNDMIRMLRGNQTIREL